MKLLYQDEHFVAVHKPSGYHVHPPEDPRIKVAKDHICLYRVRDMMKQYVYPVHRLDAATSGVLLFALSSEAASKLCHLFAQGETEKVYHAVARGWTPQEGRIDLPLELDSTGVPVPASTLYQRLGTIEFPVPVGKKFKSARYSLLEVRPLTGRYHQIRRHFNRISHPLLGDAYHGDSHHNRFFRETVGIPGLCLRASKLKITHPWSGAEVALLAPECEKWDKIQELFASQREQA
ncbi:pseudouridine synthase [Bdellovibrio sp. HCB2-146]|uniref:pseudouridine synthase n=1 Tax=Bdellovibrio sp. HCB2-146 TaxID=3394362 RepID=UPI0039BC56CA